MKSMSISMMWALLLGAFLFTSCSKEGPAGPQGEQGSVGPAGPAGPSPVIYSGWLDVIFTSAAVTGGFNWTGTITASKLTATNLSSSVMKVYVNTSTSAAPVIVEVAEIGLAAVYSLNKIELFGGSTTAADPFSTEGTGAQKIYQFRYVIIPGGTNARVANPVNWSNYAEVKEYLGLKD